MRRIGQASVLCGLGLGVIAGATACTNEPEYLPGATTIMAGTETDAMGELVPGKASLALPIKPETDKDAMDRATFQATLPDDVEVPYVKLDDISVSIEWTVTNLESGRTLTSPGGSLVLDVAFSPDGDTLAAATLTGIVFARVADLAPRWFLDFPSQAIGWFPAGLFPDTRTAPIG